MDSTRPEDQGRQFTISYRLKDDKLAVYEVPVRNSGWPGGKFLEYCNVLKPGSSNDCPEYYGPHDMYIGAMLDIFHTRFCLTSTDKFTLDFVNANPDCFPCHVRESLQKYFECNPCESKKEDQVCDPGPEVCEEPIGEGFFEHLGMGPKPPTDPCADNPNPCPMYYDWDRCRELGYNCGTQRAQDGAEPCDEICGRPCPGNADMFETKECAVCQPERHVAPDPLPPNPQLTEETQCIPPNQYDYLKDHRFDCYNPPDAEKQYETWRKQLKFRCPCPEECPEKK